MYRDNIDKELANLLNDNNEIPQVVRSKMDDAFQEIRNNNGSKDELRGKKHMNKKKVGVIAAALVGVMLVGTPIVAGVRNLILDGNFKGIQEAIDNGYVQNVEGVFAEDNNIKLELMNVVADPTTISLRFKITSDNINELKKLGFDKSDKGSISFNLIDDRGRVLEGYDPKEGSYTVPVKGDNGEDTWLTSSGSCSADTSNINNGEIYYDYMINSSEGNLKDIKGLSIEAVKMGTLKGSWRMNIDFTEEMISSETAIYEVVEGNENIEVFEAKQMATGLMIDFAIKPGLDESLIVYTNIEDMEGKKYDVERAAWMEVLEDGRDRAGITFEISKFNTLEEFYLVVENFEGKELKVKMKMKK